MDLIKVRLRKVKTKRTLLLEQATVSFITTHYLPQRAKRVYEPEVIWEPDKLTIPTLPICNFKESCWV
jgi:hypothetical protein